MRRSKAPPPRAPRVPSAQELARFTALRASGKNQRQLHEHLRGKGHDIGYSSVSALLRGDYRDERFEKLFCKFTGTSRGAMWPQE